MFQSFSATSSPEQGPPRLKALREKMAEASVDAFLVTRADAHQGEYVAHCDERLAWLTGFTGSAGFAAITQDIAGVFIDGRYRLQVRQQVADEYTPVHWPETRLSDWLIDNMTSDASVGFDPWLHTVKEVRALSKALSDKGISLVATDNMVDAIWEDRPDRPREPLMVHDDKIAGESSASKRKRLAEGLMSAGHSAAVLTLPDSICWLLNVRGADIPRTPLAQGFAILKADSSVAFFTNATADQEVLTHLGDAVELLPYHGLLDAFKDLEGGVLIDPSTAPEAVRRVLADLDEVEIAEGAEPCVLPKARKTDAEIAATKEAHLRDGAAMVEFLSWFDKTAPSGGVTEISAAKA